MSSNPTYTSLGHYKLPASHSVICGRTEYYGNHASHPWSYHSRTKPGNGTTLAKRQSSPRRSERYRLSISCCILSRWPMATGQALPVLQHLECTVQRHPSLLLPPLRGVLRLGVLPPFLKSERKGETAADTSKRVHSMLASRDLSPNLHKQPPICPVQLCYAVL